MADQPDSSTTERDAARPEARSPRGSASLLSWFALAVSVLVAFGLWMVLAAAMDQSFGDNPDLGWPRSIQAVLVDFLTNVAPFAVPAAIVLDIVAGVRGGSSRRVALIAGLVLASSLAFVLVNLAVSTLTFWIQG
jgi:hypothetical protein